ncbi:Replicative DNA helicase [Trichlorobacter thiogenes]|uniref:DNA 5'-3' helicase n=1 Tax=Trichlorobacter thiogenes TaxID=115783 RepID=A0A1T4PKS6_9BACT|nr:DnaB-like helicase C-terminal domain-containing protein [Trichlorobacter thiogenes]SJZ91961.1 Replicative DNA helicase [Trichlorobacter thiogenes]
MIPHSLIDKFSEREIIGGLLIAPDSLTNVHDLLQPGHFYAPEYGAIYAAIVEQYRAKAEPSFAALAKAAGVKPDMLVELTGDAILGARRQTAQRLVELAQKRSLLKQLQGIAARLPDMTPDELPGELIGPAVSINLEGSAKRVYGAPELAARAAELQAERQKEPGIIRGTRTNYTALDLTLRGQRPGCLTTVAAGTGVGKSTLGLNLTYLVAAQGIPTLLISTENNADENLDRLAGIITGKDIKDIESGRYAADITGRVSEALKNAPLYLTDNRPRNIHEVVGTMTRYALQHGIRYVVLDYIGEIAAEPSAPRNESEEQRLARWTQMLLDAARMLDIHLVLLAQLNRSGNLRGRPTKTELAGCFRIAQKSAALLILWQNEKSQDILTVDKNRQGAAKVDIAVRFNRANQRIRELGYWIESEDRIVPPSNATGNVADYVDLDAEEDAP